jgi:hypothetical protein
VFRAFFDHQDLAVALDDLSFDLANFFVEKNVVGQLTIEDLLTDFRHTLRTERVRGARPAERRLRFFVGLEQWLFGPLGGRRCIRLDAVEPLEYCPCALGGHGDCFFNVLNRFVHVLALNVRSLDVAPNSKSFCNILFATRFGQESNNRPRYERLGLSER